MRVLVVIIGLFTLAGCRPPLTRTDIHSYAQPELARVRHIELDLDVLFGQRQLAGSATLSVEGPGPLTLDTRGLAIERVELWNATRRAWDAGTFTLGASDPVLGAPLEIPLTAPDQGVRVYYRTSPQATALQWLDPPQTAGKKWPLLFTQSESIYARTWIPLQDSPGIRVTYKARIRTARELTAVMSADNSKNRPRTGEYVFDMPQRIPPYLIAIAVGDLEYRALSNRTGVYAEPATVELAAKEFSDTERMVGAIEAMYGPYRWQQYDIFVGPPSFPIGGMENPRLTFATPTVLAGDKSLVGLIAHELAHSWSGNLVSNATWRDLWLNEGFTTYLENRIQEKLYGRERAEKEFAIEVGELREEMKRLAPRDQILWVNLDGRDPEEGFTQVPYVKGALLLRTLEREVGREKWDAFLREYFARFAFESITTSTFLDFLRLRLPESVGVDVSQWVYASGLPDGAALPAPGVFAAIDAAIVSFGQSKTFSTEGWSTQDWLRFLRGLPEDTAGPAMTRLDEAYKFSATGNSEILTQWLRMSIRAGYEPGLARLEPFLLSVGRQKMLRPLYTELARTEAGKAKAREIFGRARAGYHPLAAAMVANLLK
ncbi:MAG: M1 family metallopeptidase [Bryobacteraceae bacterium]|nr:M1 family metallopeptidase [Bryobacteraceae bacterium]